jgi:hypothetical protein
VTPAVRGRRLRMRGIETIDSELRLVVAIRRMIREEEGRTPSTWHIDQLLDVRNKSYSTG